MYTPILITLQEDVEGHSKLPNRRMADFQCPDSISMSCPSHKLKLCFGGLRYHSTETSWLFHRSICNIIPSSYRVFVFKVFPYVSDVLKFLGISSANVVEFRRTFWVMLSLLGQCVIQAEMLPSSSTSL